MIAHLLWVGNVRFLIDRCMFCVRRFNQYKVSVQTIFFKMSNRTNDTVLPQALAHSVKVAIFYV